MTETSPHTTSAPAADAPGPTVLLVEDDDATRTFLADNLASDGYEPLVAASARDALRLAAQHAPDVVVLDVGLPDATGLRVLDRIRGAESGASPIDPTVPVIVVSGRAAEVDRVRGLDRGADDYVCKPVGYLELRARVAAVLRRSGRRRRAGTLRCGDLVLDPVAREVHQGGDRVHLSQKEFSLLHVLISEPTRVFTKSELMQTIWGYADTGTSRTLDSHACRLRRKIARDGVRHVVNVWGVGYRLVEGVEVR